MTEGIDRMPITTEHVTFRPGDTELLLKEIGYGAEEATDDYEKEQEVKDKEIKNLRNIFIMSAILSLPLFMAMFVGIFSIESLMFLHNPILQLSLAAPVQFR